MDVRFFEGARKEDLKICSSQKNQSHGERENIVEYTFEEGSLKTKMTNTAIIKQ